MKRFAVIGAIRKATGKVEAFSHVLMDEVKDCLLLLPMLYDEQDVREVWIYDLDFPPVHRLIAGFDKSQFNVNTKAIVPTMSVDTLASQLYKERQRKPVPQS